MGKLKYMKTGYRKKDYIKELILQFLSNNKKYDKREINEYMIINSPYWINTNDSFAINIKYVAKILNELCHEKIIINQDISIMKKYRIFEFTKYMSN